MKKRVIIMLAFIAFAMSSCKQTKVLYKETVRCLNVELDGSETLRVTGFGRDQMDAKEQALKNAVNVILFKGVKDGNQGCNMRPLIEEPNARKKYEDYFDEFFRDGGEYLKYVSLDDKMSKSDYVHKTSTGRAYEMTVRVLRPELKRRMKQDNIIR